MIELELFGPSLVTLDEAQRLCTEAAARLGVEDGHVAIELVDETRIAQLNGEYRQKPEPTDVLSFPIDGIESLGGAADLDEPVHEALANPGVPRELGDIVICPEHTVDLREAIVHGMLHLLGMDHERDDGEMLALQHELLSGAPR